MMKIVASLIILGLCANVALSVGVTPVSSTQSGAFTSSVLNSSAVQIIKLSNATDSAVYDSSSTSTDVAGVDGLIFGPGATNDTSYVWGLLSSQPTTAVTTGAGSCGAAGALGCGYVSTTSSLRKRTINNTIAGWGNDTTQASVIGDTAVSVSIIGDAKEYAQGPGYLAILSSGLDTAATPNYQVYVTVINGATGAASQKTLTTTADVWGQGSTAGIPAIGTACTTTTFSLGNIWYDKYSGAFLYTYSKKVITTAVATTAGTCSSTAGSTVNTIYLGAIYVNGTALLTTPISVSAATPANDVSSLVGGVDNSNYASYVWLAYKDNDASTPTTYVSKTLISVNTTAVGSFSSLVADSIPTAPSGTATYTTMEYTPVAVWASNFTYAVAVANTTTQTPYTSGSASTPVVTTYGVTNYFNGTTTGVATAVSIVGTSGTLAGYSAWQLNTGYTVVSATTAATGSPATTTYSLATFFANGTANTTSTTVGSFSYGGPQFYEDKNGTMWVGWNDVDTSTNGELVTNAYLAKFQGQLNIATGASILSALSAFVALFLAAIFVF